MDWLDQNRSSLRPFLNTWFSSLSRQPIALPVTLRRPRLDSLSLLQTWLIRFSQLDIALRIKSEFKLFDRIYVQSHHQIRSFPYLPSLRKVRQVAKRFFAVDLNGVCADIATTKLTAVNLLTQQSFESLQWRTLSALELLSELALQSENLIAHLTQEMSVPVFVHFPVAFISLSASLAFLSREYKSDVWMLFSRLRTLDRDRAIDFPEDLDAEVPELPWDPSFEVKRESISPAAAAIPKPGIAKIDFQIEGKPMTQLRGKPPTGTQKPKSSLDRFGF
jgi:hypothetical protein